MNRAKTIRCVLAHSSLKVSEKIILAAMLLRASKDMKCSASITDLASYTDFSRSTVWVNLNNLKNNGFLTANASEGDRAKTLYSINIKKNTNTVRLSRTLPAEPCKRERSVYNPDTPIREAEEALSIAAACFNDILPELGRTKTVTRNDIKKFAVLIQNLPQTKTLLWWQNYFKNIRKSGWLMGENPQRWKPSFSFLVKESTIKKVEAGGYGLTSIYAPRESVEEYVQKLYEKLFPYESTDSGAEK